MALRALEPELPRACEGCQFGATPDYAPDAEDLAPYRSMRYLPRGPLLECHRNPGQPCAGLLREMRDRPRADGDYFGAQTALRGLSPLERMLEWLRGE